jgi:cytochrome P450
MSSMTPFASLPGPAPMPVLGWRGNLARFFRDPIAYTAPLPRTYGTIVSFARGGAGPVLVRGSQSGSTIFAFGSASAKAVWGQMNVFHSTRLPGPPESRSFKLLTSGLFNLNDEKHRKMRRLLQPAFSPARLASYHDIMVASTERGVDTWRAGETRELTRELTRFTLEVSNMTLFGLESTPSSIRLNAQIQLILDLLVSPLAFLPINVPGSPRRRLNEASERVEQSLRELIGQKRAAGIGGNDILSTLMTTPDEDGKLLSDDKLIGQVFIMFFAGHDTTKVAVAWTLFLLVQHPKILADVLDELRGVLKGSAPRHDQMPQLPLLDRVVKETMRLLPPAPFAGRITVQPTTLGGVDLPVGTEVIMSSYCLHREPDLYPEPQKFRPERWEKMTPSPFEYAPFGAGPRTCLGASFAMLEVKVVLAILLQRFGFELAKSARIDRWTTVVMSPRHGLPMTLHKPGTITPPTRVRGNVHEMVELP